MPKLSPGQLVETIEHDYKVLRILKSVHKEIEEGVMRGIEISKSLARAWYQISCSRMYIQSDVNLEELNMEAMGLIRDAKSMIDALVSWQKRMTLHGKIYITQSITSAGANLNLVLTELESWLYDRKAIYRGEHFWPRS